MQPSRNAHTIALVKRHGKTFVAGMYWQTLHHAVSYVHEAKTLGRENGMCAFAVRKTRLIIQAGYAPAGPESLQGARSLASALAHALGDNWIGIFAVDAGTYALVAVLDGGVMPGRDMVGSFDAVTAMFRDTTALIDASNGEKCFKRYIAPAEFGYGADTLSLDTLLRGAPVRHAARLRPVVFAFPERKTLIRIGAAAVLAAGAVSAVVVLRDRHALQNARRQADIERAARDAAGAQAMAIPTAYRAPWELSAAAIDTARTCDNAMNLPLSIAGWILAESTCTAGSVRARYSRGESAPLSTFRAGAKQRFGGDIEASDNGNQATVAVAPNVPPVDIATPANDFDATVAFASYFQQRRVTATLTELDGPALPDLPGAAPYEIPWKMYGFTIETHHAPSVLLRDMGLNGLRISTIAMTLNDGQPAVLRWSIAGELYVLR